MGGRRLFIVRPLWAFRSEAKAGHEGRSHGGTPNLDGLGVYGAGASRFVHTAACGLPVKGRPRRNRRDTGPPTVVATPVT
jgi:hypothetical protein